MRNSHLTHCVTSRRLSVPGLDQLADGLQLVRLRRRGARFSRARETRRARGDEASDERGVERGLWPPPLPLLGQVTHRSLHASRDAVFEAVVAHPASFCLGGSLLGDVAQKAHRVLQNLRFLDSPLRANLIKREREILNIRGHTDRLKHTKRSILTLV